ncbi:hypothetical protein ACWEVO_36205, partial [Micromonospora sp. NPDC003776]
MTVRPLRPAVPPDGDTGHRPLPKPRRTNPQPAAVPTPGVSPEPASAEAKPADATAKPTGADAQPADAEPAAAG